MSETLRECEGPTMVEANGDITRSGKWTCSRDGEKIEWKSTIKAETLRKHTATNREYKAFVETEQRCIREAAAQEIEKHLRSHG